MYTFAQFLSDVEPILRRINQKCAEREETRMATAEDGLPIGTQIRVRIPQKFKVLPDSKKF